VTDSVNRSLGSWNAADVEYGLGTGTIGTLTDLVGARTRPQAETERVYDERLATACLTGEQVEAAAEDNARAVDQGQVPHMELFKHWPILCERAFDWQVCLLSRQGGFRPRMAVGCARRLEKEL
jgi:hypothetical protein